MDLLLLETASDLEELLMAVEEARSVSDLPVLASMTFGEELVAMDGTTPAAADAALAAAGVDAIGVNCGVGPGGVPGRAGGHGPRRRTARRG